MKITPIPLPRRKRAFQEVFPREGGHFGSVQLPRGSRFGGLPRLLLLMMAAALLILGLYCAAKLWRVREVKTEDGHYYTAAAVLAHADLEAGDGMLDFDSSDVITRLRRGLPLLDKVQIRKSLGGTVTIRFTEESELYYTQHNVNYYIISAKTHRVLCVSATPDEARRVGAVYIGLPEATRVRVGEELSFVNLPYQPDSRPGGSSSYEIETDEPAKEYAYVFSCVETVMGSELGSRVVGMELGDRYDIQLVLTGHIRVRLGNTDELERKLSVIYRSLLERQEQGTVDPTLPTLVDASDPARILYRTAPDIAMPPWDVTPPTSGDSP